MNRAFAIGDRVTVINATTTFYTRNHAFICGKTGVIVEHRPDWVVPEDEAIGRGTPERGGRMEPFYVVRFNQKDLWPNYSGSDADTLDTQSAQGWLQPARKNGMSKTHEHDVDPSKQPGTSANSRSSSWRSAKSPGARRSGGPAAPPPRLKGKEMEQDQRRRPDPLRWIWYTFGGGLGPRYRQWVLYDLTGPTRWLRQFARAIVQVAPLATAVLLALGFGWITWVGVGCGLVLALIYSAAYFDPAADHRLVKHGYPPGTAQRILTERDKAKHPDRMRRYVQTYRNNAT